MCNLYYGYGYDLHSNENVSCVCENPHWKSIRVDIDHLVNRRLSQTQLQQSLANRAKKSQVQRHHGNLLVFYPATMDLSHFWRALRNYFCFFGDVGELSINDFSYFVLQWHPSSVHTGLTCCFSTAAPTRYHPLHHSASSTFRHAGPFHSKEHFPYCCSFNKNQVIARLKKKHLSIFFWIISPEEFSQWSENI